MCTPNEVITVAKQEVGYFEKATNDYLDNKTANKGSGNWTKYARDLDAITDFYNGKKNGFAWCDIFVDWCFYKAFGAEKARELLCQPLKSAGAGCIYSFQYYKKAGQTGKTPRIGAQIFFGYSEDNLTHTGLVYNVDSNYIYTIEGNTADCVDYRKYEINSPHIWGYGYPAYDNFPISDDETKPKVDNIDIIASEVIAGLWGVGETRKTALTSAGYDYAAIQKRVNDYYSIAGQCVRFVKENNFDISTFKKVFDICI